MKRRRRAIGNPTKAEQAYQDAQRAHGCAMCRLMGIDFGSLPDGYSPCGMTEIHHRTTGDMHGQKQLGHDATVALGSWHHRGELMPGRRTVDAMRDRYGPSLAHHKKDFLCLIWDVLGERSTAALQRWADEQREGRLAA